jgi:hypothetical protein
MIIRAIAMVPCPCHPQASDTHCKAKVYKAAAAQHVDKERAFVPHQDATLCRKCNVWWGNRAPKLRSNGHPCMPEAPSEQVEPWPLPKKEEKEPTGVDTLTPSPPRAADADGLLKNPDFRDGEGLTRLGPLAVTPVRSLMILVEADPDLARALVRKAFARETRQDHVRMLIAVGEAARELAATDDPRQDQPVTPWLLDWLKAKARAKGWRWSTLNSNLSVAQSAFKYLPTYVRGAPSWRLHEDVAWQLAARTARTKTAAERPDQALPATTDDVFKACSFAAKTDTSVAFLLAVTWVTFGRSGALIQLRREDVELTAEPEGETCFKITLMRGKSNRLGQDPHTVSGRLGQFAQFVTPLIDAVTNPKAFVIHAPSARHRDNLRTAKKSALRSATGKMQLESRSLRRGSLQTLANAGASIATLLACSGHSTAKSLKRYLNFGRVLTEEQRAATRLFDAIVKPSADVLQSC